MKLPKVVHVFDFTSDVAIHRTVKDGETVREEMFPNPVPAMVDEAMEAIESALSPGCKPLHGHDTTRCDQPNRWFGSDTCECLCGCAFLSEGHPDDPLCPKCSAKPEASR